MIWNFLERRRNKIAIDFLLQDCATTLRDLKLYAPKSARVRVAERLIEQLRLLYKAVASDIEHAEQLLNPLLQGATYRRQLAVSEAALMRNPRLHEGWAIASLIEGYLQVILLSEDRHVKEKIRTMIMSWVEEELGREKVRTILQ